MTALAESRARELLRAYCITSPEGLRNLEEIANAEGLIVEDARLINCQGKIRYEESYGLIKVSNAIREPGTRRFVTAHEMGHYYNDKKRETFCKAEDLIGVKSNKVDEDNANAFAVELLMKKEWYSGFVKEKEPGIETIKAAAEYFGVSLSAAAIRYSQAGNFPVAVIMVHKGKVSWSAISELFPYQYVGRGYPANGASEADAFFNGQEANLEPHTVLADSWFLNDRTFRHDHMLVEQVLPMPNYHSLLAVIWEA